MWGRIGLLWILIHSLLIATAGLWRILVWKADWETLRHSWTGDVEELPLRDSIWLARALLGRSHEPLEETVMLPAGCAETTPIWLVGLVGQALDVRCGFHPERLAVAHVQHPVAHLLMGASGPPPLLAPLGKVPSAIRWLAGGGWIALYEVQPGEAQPAVHMDLPTDIGWRLLGYTVLEETDRLTVITFWQVEHVPEDPWRWAWRMQPFHHLLDPHGRQVQNPSGFGMPGFLWREGDLYVDRTVMPFQRGESLRLEIGLFDPNRGVRARFLKGRESVDALVLRAWDAGRTDEGASGR